MPTREPSLVASPTSSRRRVCLILLTVCVAAGGPILLAIADGPTSDQPADPLPERDARAGAKRNEPDQRRKPLPKSDAEWSKILTRQQFEVLRKKKTERAFSGKLWNTKAEGAYHCAGCNEKLFSSDVKFDSGTGWPSFWSPLSDDVIATKPDYHFFVRRIEVLCRYCQGHLGHVFNDGPPPTGLRYCINSAALEFKSGPPAKSTEK